MKITLQIPIEEYGTLATLAAMAKMPIDKYVLSAETLTPSNPKPTTEK